MSALRVAVAGDDRAEAAAAVQRAGALVVDENPDVVLTHGGDGSLLRAERIWPQVPKMPVRLSRKTAPCPLHGIDDVLARLQGHVLEEVNLGMLELALGRARFYAMNDIVVRNAKPTAAMRFSLTARGGVGPLPDIVHVGDGLVAATAYGSTAYFHSVSRTRIAEGWGVAFNNVSTPAEPIVIAGSTPGDAIEVQVIRGPAFVVYDNDERMPVLREGHHLTIGPARRVVTVLGLDALACQECRRLADGETFNPH